MQRTRLQPGTTRVAMLAWSVQAVVAVLWVASSTVDGASWWIWPFGLTWAGVALTQAYRARRQAVVVDPGGLRVLTGITRAVTVPWDQVEDITPEPTGRYVAHLAVVLTDGGIVDTPLAKGDDRLRELWLGRHQNA